MFDVIIVVYNKKLAELQTINSLEQDSNVDKIFICDNSDRIKDDSYFKSVYRKIIYVDMHGNQGLSRAYNTAFKMATSEFICIMDDDTCFNDAFLTDAFEYVKSTCADIFVPVVKENGVIYSPCLQYGPLYVPIKNLSEIDGKNFSAINSGTIFRRNAFTEPPFDENLFLDFVDHQFFSNAYNMGKKVIVMKNVLIEQSFSFNGGTFNKKRFETFRKDSKVFYSGSLLGRLFRLAQLTWKRVTLLRYK